LSKAKPIIDYAAALSPMGFAALNPSYTYYRARA